MFDDGMSLIKGRKVRIMNRMWDRIAFPDADQCCLVAEQNKEPGGLESRNPISKHITHFLHGDAS